MSRFVPGRGFEPDPRGIDRNDPKALADYNRRREEFYNKPIKKDFFGRETPRNDRGNRPIRDKHETPGRWQDQKLPDGRPLRDGRIKNYPDRERGGIGGGGGGGRRGSGRGTLGTALGGLFADIFRKAQEEKGRATQAEFDKKYGQLLRPGGPPSVRYAPGETPPAHHRKPNWWEKPRTPSPRRGGEIGRGLDTDMDRLSLLTGQGSTGGGSLGADAERMRLLTGGSNFGGREEYDPQDRDFNRQFDERPRGPQPWDYTPEKTGFYDTYSGDKGPFSGGRYSGDKGPFSGGRYSGDKGPFSGGRGPKRGNWGERIGYTGPGTMDFIDSDRDGTDDRNQTGPGAPGWTPYDDSDLKKRIAALEERGSLVTQPTQDLSGIKQRITDLEGRQPSWQEKRIKDLEGRQDDTSWKDSLSLLETGQQTGKKARSALDTRLASLENYYKNDPPPKESVGNRYKDKYNQLNKLWEREGKAQKWGDSALKEPGYKGKAHWDYSYANDQGQAWAGDLPTGYVEGIRNLNREYNKPVHSAIIKGREYKAYDPRAAARLRYLDKENIHEDTYLGQGKWKDQYGEDVYGYAKGYKDRYFKSQSGLKRDSDEYKKRFTGRSGNMGKDYAWYQ